MPLIQGKSKQTFSKNVGAEMDSGKPQNQALAIAYAIKRKNAKKMDKGGMFDDEEMDSEDKAEEMDSHPMVLMAHPAQLAKMIQMKRAGSDDESADDDMDQMSDGGMYPTPKDKNYADGGMIDIGTNNHAEEQLDDLGYIPENDDNFAQVDDEGMHERADDPRSKNKRKGVLTAIMRDLHARR